MYDIHFLYILFFIIFLNYKFIPVINYKNFKFQTLLNIFDIYSIHLILIQNIFLDFHLKDFHETNGRNLMKIIANIN